MKNYAWINTKTNLVENTILYDGNSEISLPDGVFLIEYPNEGIQGSWSMMGIGWSYINGEFVEPPKPPNANTATNRPISTGA